MGVTLLEGVEGECWSPEWASLQSFLLIFPAATVGLEPNLNSDLWRLFLLCEVWNVLHLEKYFVSSGEAGKKVGVLEENIQYTY